MTIWVSRKVIEVLAVEQLIAKAGVEALDVAVLPRAAPLDVGGLALLPAAAGCTIPRPARACRAGGCLWGPSAPHVARSLDPLVVDYPARRARRPCDSLSGRSAGQARYIGCETVLVVTTARDLALRRAMLPQRQTGATLGDMQLRSDLLNAGTATRGP